EVKAGDKLYAFDDSIQKGNLERAKAAVKLAETKLAEAKQAETQYSKKLEVMKSGVDLAKEKANLAAHKYYVVQTNYFRIYKTAGHAEDTWKARFQEEPAGFEANAEWILADGDWKVKKADLAVAEAVDPQLPVKEAQAVVDQAKAEEANAQNAVDLCLVK